MTIKDQVKLVDRYLGRNTLQGFLLVLSILVVLFSFLELLAQINDVGKGRFGLVDAFMHTALTLPKRAADLMPMSALLGSIVALGLMADHHELTALQAAGMSVRRICTSVIVTSVLLMLAAIIVAEFVAPPLEQYARIRRSQAVYGKSVKMSKSGFWVRQGRFFIHVGSSISLKQVAEIELYEIDADGNLKQFMLAKRALLQEGRSWLLKDVEQNEINGDIVTHHRLADYRLDNFLSPDQMEILKLPPESLSLSDLYAYIFSLKERKQNAHAYAHAFWQKLCLPLTTAAMVLLSLTFIFGPTRMRSAGQRIAIGMLVGVMFYLLNQILGHLGLLLDLPPLLTSLAPVALILTVALRLLRRAV